jgi:biopolymer transport protein ExbD
MRGRKLKIRFLLAWAAAFLVSVTAVSAQLRERDLPRGFEAAKVDPQVTNGAAIIVSITADGKFYLGKDATPKDELGSKISNALREHTVRPKKVIYLAANIGADYSVVVELLNIVREQGVGQIALIVKREIGDDSQIGILPIFVPMSRSENEDIGKLKPNPLTLVAAMNKDLELRLNQDSGGRRGQLCFEAVPQGLGRDPSRLRVWLDCLFRYRTAQRAYRIGMETRNDLPLEERIEKTVFVKAPLSVKYNDVLRVVNAVKAAGADPIGLQIDDLLK